MQVAAVVGHSNSGKTTLIERLVTQLAERGTVGTVKHIDCAPDLDTAGKDTHRHRQAGAAVAYGLADQEWFATGDRRTLSETLDALARECDYALVEGYRGARLPTIALGDDHGIDEDRIIARGTTADDVDLEAAVTAIEDLEPYETLPSLIDQITTSPKADHAGAIATFTGRVRKLDHPDDDATEYLEFDRYDAIADDRLEAIRSELAERDGVQAVALYHRTGIIEAGEDIVYVVVLAGHRDEAFRTVEDGINRLKEEVPLFKKEVTVTDEFWAHERHS